MKFTEQQVTAAREMLASASARASELKQLADEAAQNQQVWAELVEYLSKGWALHALATVQRRASEFPRPKSQNDPHFAVVEQALALAAEEAPYIIRRFAEQFERECTAAGLALDRSSRHPRYTIQQGFFQVEIDETQRVARLSDHEGKLGELPADPVAVAQTVSSELARVFGRSFDGAKFLGTLRSQYLAVIAKQGRRDGDSVPIRQITKRLGKNVEGFRTDEFLVDLSRLAERGPFEIDQRRLDLQQTKDTSLGMLLHGAAGRGYVGFVIFKEVI